MKQQQNIIAGYDKTATAYTQQFFTELEEKPLDRLLLERFAKENKDKDLIADFGCGCGHTTQFLAQNGTKNVLGIDLSPNMVKEAQRMCLLKNVNFDVGNMLNLVYPNNYFNGAIAFYAIVHFDYEELATALKEIYRVLQSGSQFLFCFHAGTDQKVVEDFLDQSVDTMIFYFFETDKVLTILQQIGWKVLETLVRYPYEGKEFPSRRAYVLCGKMNG